ncbi:MAG TPA: hypothetical protein O0X97_06165, partial [Methanocorpusculum sp.]|nr:hypothetical protein [Methanocorpusculum sp.]
MTRHMVKIPPMLTATISMGLSALDGTLFKELDRCPYCGGRPMPYDTKEKQYVTLVSGEERRVISVKIRRFTCRECGRLLYADEPFYPDTRTGSAVIDLAIGLCRTSSFSHAAAVMNALGIEINRGSVRKFAQSNLPMAAVSPMYGLPMPYSFISLLGRGISVMNVRPDDVLKSSGYPSRYRPQENIETAVAYFRQKKEMKKRPQTF